MDWYILGWRRYADFRGRSGRKEFWIHLLGYSVIGSLLFSASRAFFVLGLDAIALALLCLSLVWIVIAYLPLLACSVRRLHDTGRTGLWVLIGFIAILGQAVLFVFWASKGDPLPNRYGPQFEFLPGGELPPRQSPELYQLERVAKTLSAPSKTFEDIKRGNTSWWMPFLIVLLTGGFLFFAVTKEVTWKTVYENQQNAMPEFAKRMQAQMPPEQKAAADRRGPITQEITWALSPIGLLLMNMIAALILWPTINFGFAGKATFGKVLAVTMYATLVLWPIKLILAGVSLFAGVAPEAFNLQNIAGTNVAYYLSKQDTPAALYALLMYLDPLVIWNLCITAIGLAVVAGVKRSSGYIAVFGWWVLLLLIGVGFAAAFS